MPRKSQPEGSAGGEKLPRKSHTWASNGAQFPSTEGCVILPAPGLCAALRKPLAETSGVSEQPLHCALFCAIVDNFGDIGVCWRLARQLTHEHGVRVTLWVDDIVAAERFMASQGHAKLPAFCEGVDVRHWPSHPGDFAEVLRSDLLIEAFACHLPRPLLDAMGRAERLPVWVNLEYLSAEPWVAEHHLLASLLHLPGAAAARPPARKTFFFPGFTPATGGLLRESGLLQRHDHWQRNVPESRRQLLRRWHPRVAETLAPDALLISLFSYETAAMASWLQALADDSVPTLLLVSQGRSLAGVAAFLEQPLEVGEVVCRGALQVLVIPFMAQDDYDELLSLCDFNCVRGEDSFVRAQWAARPLLWHIYPQQEQAHLQKLEAFLQLQQAQTGPCDALQAASALALGQFMRFWNQGEDCGELWHHLRPQLSGLRERAGKWQQHLAEMPDLATSLLRFCRSQSR